MKKYFVFDRHYNKNNPLWVVCCLEKRLLKEVEQFKLIDSEEISIRERRERALRFLGRRKIKEVWSYREKNAFDDALFGFKLHHSKGEDKPFFHYDFIDPAVYGEVFHSRGIALREFRGELPKNENRFLIE